MKQYQCITKDEDFFLKSSNEILTNMKHFQEVCNVTLVSQDNERIRALKVVLASQDSCLFKPKKKKCVLMVGNNIGR